MDEKIKDRVVLDIIIIVCLALLALGINIAERMP